MSSEEELLYKRFTELARRSEGCGYFIFTDFLGLGERSIFLSAMTEFGSKVKYNLHGGACGTERVMARLGDEEELGYSAPYPIKTVRIVPQSLKFAENLTHRDYLGSILALGIERAKVGDIVILEGETYVFAEEQIAEFIAESLDTVRHTKVRCAITDKLPDGPLFTTRRIKIQAVGERLDAVVAKVFSLSRDEAARLFHRGLVFLDGSLCESLSKIPKEGQVVSVRGKGRFIYLGYETLTKKGKKNIEVDLYV